ncbi:unnamed protein product [Orchesella dallaii]|uniref:Uncharacterized protein n=1 Tax=Orchesella dallaii TaxID=48710 RepID=A0ABP1REV4_9HEXA
MIDNLLLTSCQLLRTLFLKRWKEQTSKHWASTEHHGRQVINDLGERLFKSVQPLQKVVIETGCLEDWDLSTLSLILQHCGSMKNLYKTENEGVKSLSKLRNELNNNSKKKLSREEYNQKLGVFRTTLRTLKVDEKKIKMLISSAGVTSSTLAFEATSNLFEKAENHVQKEEYDLAIEILSEAAAIPSLLPVHQALAFEKRSEWHLKLAEYYKTHGNEVESEKVYSKAVADASSALSLNQFSWRAHQILGEDFQKQDNLEEAINHYERALAISPSQEELELVVSSLKALFLSNLAEKNVIEHEPTNRTQSENVDEFKIDTETMEMTPTAVDVDQSKLDQNIAEGQAEVERGNQFKSRGNLSAAIHCYQKATELGTPEGIHELASCYQKGLGVEKDLSKAHQLFLKAASLPSTIPSRYMTKLKRNAAVACAQQALGLMYEQGMFVEQNYSTSASWYKKAAENGNELSLNNLGLFYNHGKGVPRNEEEGAKYLNQAVNLGAANATSALMFYYLEQMEVEKARDMLKKGKEMRFPPLMTCSERHFQIYLKTCSPYKRMEHERDVLAFEKKHKLNIEGMTFLERLERKLDYKEGEPLTSTVSSISQEVIPTEEERVKSTIKDFGRLAHFFEEDKLLSDEEKSELVEIMYKGAIHEYDAFTIPTVISTRLKSLLTQLYKEKCEQEGEVNKSDSDMKLRFVYLTFIQRENQSPEDAKNLLKLAKDGLEMYPDNPNYYAFVSRLHVPLRDNVGGLQYAEKGLEKFPDDAALLHIRSNHLYHLVGDTDEDTKKLIKAYKDFLREVPYDHWQVPKIYYLMAQRYIQDVTSRSDSRRARNGRRMMRYYQWLGDAAETNVHGYFRRQAEFVTPIKNMIKLFLSKFDLNDD